MPSRLRHHFRHLPASPRYLVGTWPRGACVMQAVRFDSRWSYRDLASVCQWAGLDVDGRSPSVVPASALRRLICSAARNASGNTYHHAGHFAHVVMAAGLLAAGAGLNREDRRLLVLAGLVHDLDHQGRRASPRLYHQERMSARRAVRVIVGCGGDARLSRRLHSLLRATALTGGGDRSLILKSDRLARLLTDADIFASVVYTRPLSVAMTRALKLEQRLAAPTVTLHHQFAEMISISGLQSDLAQSMLHAVLRSRHPARNALWVSTRGQDYGDFWE